MATVSLALPLALEAMEPGLMHRPPRAPGEPLLLRFVLIRTAYVGALMSVVSIALFLATIAAADESMTGSSPPAAHVVAEAQTLAVTALALFQVFYLLTCRTLTEPVRLVGWWSNPWLFVGIGVLLVLQAGFIYLPFMQTLFHTAPLTAAQWALAALAGAIVLPVVGLEKRIRRRRS